MRPVYRCWAEIDLSALRENLAWIRHQAGPGVRILTVVKADAYGHGLRPIAGLLMQSGTDLFGVANLREAQSIRAVGQGWPILMLGSALPDEVPALVRDEVRGTISTLEEAQNFSCAAQRLRRRALVHLKVDTGMGRLGAEPEAVLGLARAVQQLPGLVFEGIYTHFAAAEDDAEFSAAQARCFAQVLEQLAGAGFRPELVHANNSAAFLSQPDTLFNLIRPGLLVYGVVPPGRRRSDSVLRKHLRPALSWYSRVSICKQVPKGKTLSYGRTFTAPRRMRVATLTAGYGDGYFRAGSNRAQVLIRNCRCRVLGRITMDQMLVDVSRLPVVEPGDVAVLIGRQGGQEITATEVAEWCGTVPWEVLTNITYRVPRMYVGTQAA